MLRLNDEIQRPRGIFRLKVFRHGELIETYEDNNLVVNVAKTTLSRLIGGDVTDRSITQISFGTNGTAPAAGNTSITSPYTKDIDLVSYPSASSVQFDFTLGLDEANGKTIAEFGLLTEGGALFARKHRPAGGIPKDDGLSFSGSWIIQF